MSGSRSDASTSTDDVKGRPLCLFYFTHPFGVLSPEPPSLAPAPPHVARAYVNMQPWGDPAAPWPDPSAPWAPSAGPWGSPAGPWGSHTGVWGSGDASYSYASRSSPERSAPVVTAPAPRRESLSSSLFSSEAWWSTAARRPAPYGMLLPPLRLPVSLEPSTLEDSDDFWPIKCVQPEKFSLPPIEMPSANVVSWTGAEGERARSRRAGARRRRRLGVRKPRRADLRRSIAGLMRRVLAGARATPLSPALRHTLRTLRDAWPDPARPCSKSSSDEATRLAALYSTQKVVPATRAPTPVAPAMLERAPVAPRASPGLLRRRYSVPETIMRKYRLAQQRSDSDDESAPPSDRTATCASALAAAERRSATLRRAAPCRACCCCSRSLEASRAELRASGSPRRAADMLRAAMRNSYERAGDARISADTYRSHASRRRRLDRSTDSPSHFSRTSSVETAPGERISLTTTRDDLEDYPAQIDRRDDCEEARSDSTVSPPTAVEASVVSVQPTSAPPYEMLELVVSETLSGDREAATQPRRSLGPPPTRDRLDLDEYVSNILVESLNSLTDQLETMTASMDADRRVSIVEKEIKVRLQNAAVNTIVHLSPTSNNQIIFGNEELGGIASSGGEVQNTRDPRDVLLQIGRLFRGAGTAPGEASDVDEYLLERETLEGPLGSVGPCNYFAAIDDNPAVPRFSAIPHTVSMEVNASSSDEPDPGGSECTSLVDSLDDPNSPRVAACHHPSSRAPSDMIASLSEDVPPREPEAFFIKIQGDACECVSDEASVAERMPDKIRQRLHRRHRKRELRMECLRRGRGRSARNAQARAERAARALLDALLDDVISVVARDEYRNMRQRRHAPHETGSRPTAPPAALRSDAPRKEAERHRVRGKLSLVARPALPVDERATKRIYQKSEIREGDKCVEILEILEYVNGSRSSPESAASDENHQVDCKTKKSRIPIPINEKNLKSPVTETRKTNWGRASTCTPDSRDEASDKIAEMLASALGSPQHAPLDSPPRAAPAPFRPSPTPSRPASRESNDPGRRASVPHENRSRSNSLRFRRVFDMIPEERAAGPDEHEADRRASAPDLVAPAPSPPMPVRLHRATNTSPVVRSAATSPPAPRALRAPRSDEAVDNGDNDKGDACRVHRERRAPRPPRPTPRRRKHGVHTSSAALPDRDGARTTRRDRSEEESTSPTCREAGEAGESVGGGDDSSRSSESGASLLCPLAPRWLAPRRRAARTPRTSAPADRPPAAGAGGVGGAGGWSVTVAGSCRAALPQEVEMRLHFSNERATPCQECSCAHCAACSCGARPATPRAAPPRAASHRPPPPPLARTDSSKLTLTMKKEALDSSILASKSTRKASEPLPEVETYRASRSKLKSSVKMRRGYSLHCWLPDADDAPIRANEGELSVLGSAIVPELKPRARTMSERDLTRVHPPRCSLRC